MSLYIVMEGWKHQLEKCYKLSLTIGKVGNNIFFT